MARRGYVPLRRGILEHLPNMSPNAVKTYVALLCLADWETGTLTVNVRDLADLVGISASTVSIALRELETPFEGRKEGYVVWNRSRSRWEDSTIRVTRWSRPESGDKSGDKRGKSRSTVRDTVSSPEPYVEQYTTSEQGERVPKKSEEREKRTHLMDESRSRTGRPGTLIEVLGRIPGYLEGGTIQ
jgi:hypothetical protein